MPEISCDLGEAADEAGRQNERVIWTMIDAANVACGGHAGDEQSMREAVGLARERGIVLGAHPSYPDRENFGRRSIAIDRFDLRGALSAQITLLREIARRERVPLRRVKPHGALYNDAHRDTTLAEAILDAMQDVDPALAIVAADASAMAAVARERGVNVVREAFADRRYMADGSLTPRAEKDALLSVDEAADQALLLARERAALARGGSRIAIVFETICIHADMENSAERLRRIRARLASI